MAQRQKKFDTPMMALTLPTSEVSFLLSSLAAAAELYHAAGERGSLERLKKINAEFLHQSGIEPPSRWAGFSNNAPIDKH